MRKNLENIVFFRGKLVNLQGMIKPVEYTINVRGRLVDLSQPKVMGILNVTPDSFYSGSRKQTEQEIAARAPHGRVLLKSTRLRKPEGLSGHLTLFVASSPTFRCR